MKTLKKILFEIPGEPVAQGRPRAGRTWAGKTVLYDPTKSRDFKQFVRLVASQHAPKELITGLIRLFVDVYRPTPKRLQTKPKQALINSGELRPTTKPDCSNYLKGIEDALTGVIWKDDSQIIEVTVRKFYSNSPKTVVVIKEW